MKVLRTYNNPKEIIQNLMRTLNKKQTETREYNTLEYLIIQVFIANVVQEKLVKLPKFS